MGGTGINDSADIGSRSWALYRGDYLKGYGFLDYQKFGRKLALISGEIGSKPGWCPRVWALVPWLDFGSLGIRGVRGLEGFVSHSDIK